MEQFSNTSPAVGAGLVVVGANGGHYYAFDAATGAPRWDYVADGIVHLAAPLIAGGRVYMAGGGKSNRVLRRRRGDGRRGDRLADHAGDAGARHRGDAARPQRAVSSLAAVAGLIILQTRLDDALDTNADGRADRYLSRESLVGIDPASAAVVWQRDLARAEVGDPNDVPKFFVCPTPAGFASDGGSALVAAASSLAPAVVVFDGVERPGAEPRGHVGAGAGVAGVRQRPPHHRPRWRAPSRGSASSVNHAPSAPIAAGNARPIDSADVTLRWLPAADPDAELPSYEIRIDTDGELLETWQQQLYVGAGVTSLRLTAPVADGVTYTFAVRARDARGALSPWSVLETFSVVTNPSVSVGGTPATSLRAAVAAAQPGDVIMLGAGDVHAHRNAARRGRGFDPGRGRRADDAGRRRPAGRRQLRQQRQRQELRPRRAHDSRRRHLRPGGRRHDRRPARPPRRARLPRRGHRRARRRRAADVVNATLVGNAPPCAPPARRGSGTAC